MKKTLITFGFCAGLVAAVEAAPTDAVTQADLQALKALIQQQNAKIEAQAKRIAELEGKQTATAAKVEQVATAPRTIVPGEGTETNETGRIWTMADGRKFYLADATAGIFSPLTESGLQFEPYGYLVLEAVHNTAGTDYPMFTDWVRPRSNRNVKNHNGDHTSTLSVNDSILGFNLFSAESYNGWKTGGKFEFDLAGDDANHTDFHVRHLYWKVEHESGWQFLFGQTWHLWKMVTPQEIDGAWMENAGYPYRRSPQIRVTKKWDFDDDSSLEIRAGLVKNGPGMGGDRDGDGTQDNEQSGWCLLEGAVIYDRKAFWEDEDKRWLIGIAGQYGRDKSRRATGFDDETGAPNEFLGKSDEYDSDMVMVAGSLPFGKFTLTGQLFAGAVDDAEVNLHAVDACGKLCRGGVRQDDGRRQPFGVFGQGACAGEAAVGVDVLRRAGAAGLYEFLCYYPTSLRAQLACQPCRGVCLAGVGVYSCDKQLHLLWLLVSPPSCGR